jgi:hypothetical protein
MDDLPSQLRRHFESKQLPPERVQELLAAGRAAAAQRTKRRGWQMAAAAAVLVGAGLAGLTAYRRPQVIPAIAVTGAVRDFFSTPGYQLDQISANRTELTDWLRKHGGPEDFAVPPALAGLSSYGCEVLDVRGEKVFLICFLLEGPAPAASDTMPEKKMMTVVNPDGTMMKKTVPLVHLVVAPRSRFAADPATGGRVVLSAGGEWHFTTWERGEHLYLAAGAVPADRLAALTAAL